MHNHTNVVGRTKEKRLLAVLFVKNGFSPAWLATKKKNQIHGIWPFFFTESMSLHTFNFLMFFNISTTFAAFSYGMMVGVKSHVELCGRASFLQRHWFSSFPLASLRGAAIYVLLVDLLWGCSSCKKPWNVCNCSCILYLCLLTYQMPPPISHCPRPPLLIIHLSTSTMITCGGQKCFTGKGGSSSANNEMSRNGYTDLMSNIHSNFFLDALSSSLPHFLSIYR